MVQIHERLGENISQGPDNMMSPDVTKYPDCTINIGERISLKLSEPFMIKIDVRITVKT